MQKIYIKIKYFFIYYYLYFYINKHQYYLYLFIKINININHYKIILYEYIIFFKIIYCITIFLLQSNLFYNTTMDL